MDQPVREFINACPVPVASESGPGPGPVPGHGPSPGPSGLQTIPATVPVPVPVTVPVIPTTATTVAANTNSSRILSRNVNGTSKCCILHGKAVLACKSMKHVCSLA